MCRINNASRPLLAFSTLQASSWVLTYGSLNRYLLIKKLTQFEFICKRCYTTVICLLLTSFFFLANVHILWTNGFRSSKGAVICYQNRHHPRFMIWYQRVHLCLYSALPSMILFILNTLLMRIIFASKKRLHSHRRVDSCRRLPRRAGSDERDESFSLARLSNASFRRPTKNTPRKTMNRHSRKLTLSLIFITLSYFTLTFPSTVIFSFFRPYIQPLRLRRTLSLFFTNLSTTTHAIRFFIYFFCSIDFRNDFYNLFSTKRALTLPSPSPRQKHQRRQPQHADRQTNSVFIPDKNEPSD